MAEPNQTETWLARIIKLIQQSPLIAVCIYLAYQVYRMQIYVESRELKWEQRELQREKENKEIWIYYREDKKKDQEIKEKELSQKYKIDSSSARKDN